MTDAIDKGTVQRIAEEMLDKLGTYSISNMELIAVVGMVNTSIITHVASMEPDDGQRLKVIEGYRKYLTMLMEKSMSMILQQSGQLAKARKSF